jgi:hypothetical protein
VRTIPLVSSKEKYTIIEGWGKTNSGKTYLIESFCEKIDLNSEKKIMVLFTNESNYSEGIEEWEPLGYEFEVYFHRNLIEFENDIKAFYKKYRMEKVGVADIRKKIFAILVDEAEFLYREGYLMRRVEELGHDLEPRHYGIPRNKFTMMLKRLASLPTHFGVVSKVTRDFVPKTVWNKAGTKSYLTFEPSGDDKYRLPDSVAYESGIRVHLVSMEETVYQIDDEGKRKLDKNNRAIPELNELGKPIIKYRYFGLLLKQKADRDIEVIIEKPTIKKIEIRLNQLRLARKMREKRDKKREAKKNEN